jgi:hypothetical protein
MIAGTRLSHMRTRPNHRHLAAKYVEELRKFIQAQFPHEFAEAKYSRVIAGGQSREITRLQMH